MTARSRRVLGIIVLGVVVLALCVWLARRPTPAAAGTVLPAAAASSGAAASASVAVAAASAASARHAPAALLPGVQTREANAELIQRMKADWCGFGAAERDRQERAARDKAEAQAVAEAEETVGGQLVEEAVADVRQRWSQALTRRGDLRSLAVADFLVSENDDAQPARARLQARARTTSDPMVTALALQRPCAKGACSNIEASQWSRLEPANMNAWLALLNEPGGAGRQAAYVLDRLALEATRSSNYVPELLEMLQALPQATTPGLRSEAELQLLSNLAFGAPIPPMRFVMQGCRSGAVVAARCEAVAGLLWRQEEFIYRAFAMALARDLGLKQPALKARWAERAELFEAVREHGVATHERAASEPEGPVPTSPCGWQQAVRKMLDDHREQGEWTRSEAAMRKAGGDVATLAARWRARSDGRGTLDPRPDPPPPVPQASAGTR